VLVVITKLLQVISSYAGEKLLQNIVYTVL